MKWFKRLICELFGHPKFISNHVGALSCKRCGTPWEIKEKRKMPIHPQDY